MKKTLLHVALLIASGILVILLSRLFHPIPVIDEPTIEWEEPVIRFGVEVNDYDIQTFTVNPGDNLSTILGAHGVGIQEVEKLVQAARGIFDPRKLRSGQSYHVFLPRDTSRPDLLVYEEDYIHYIVFQIKDSLHVYAGARPVIRIWDTAVGSIEHSLWVSMTSTGINPALALRLSDIYAWTIDFYGIQPGDAYKVIYERLIVDTTEVGIGTIQAAWFLHNGHEKFAFRFEQGESLDYFDEKGVSLRRAFLKAPLQFSRISSRFSHSRLHPVLKIRRPHHGVDYAAPTGTPVQAVGDGLVTKAGWGGGGAGKMVKIKHNSVYSTAYLHLSGFGKGIREGKRVRQGEVIGYVGSTGLSTGPHLDFRFYKNGQPVDPLKVESPPTDPVKPEHMQAFLLAVDSLQRSLNEIRVLP